MPCLALGGGALNASPSPSVALLARLEMEAAPQQKGESIAMTSPVRLEMEEPGQGGPVSRYKVSFMMPAKYSLDSLPVPKDKGVQLLEVQPTWVPVGLHGWSPDRRSDHDRPSAAVRWRRSPSPASSLTRPR